MADFTVRVELHGASNDDYTKLHGEMAKEGFARTTVYEGVVYQLPTAEYRKSNSNGSDILQSATRAAARVKPSFEVLGTQGPAFWYNLRRA